MAGVKHTADVECFVGITVRVAQDHLVAFIARARNQFLTELGEERIGDFTQNEANQIRMSTAQSLGDRAWTVAELLRCIAHPPTRLLTNKFAARAFV